MRYFLISLFAMAAVFGCNEQSSSTVQVGDSPADQATQPPSTTIANSDPLQTDDPIGQVDNNPAQHTQVTTSPSHGELGTSVPVGLTPTDETEYFVRSRRRMNLDQLQAQISHATGGRQWTVNNKNQLEELAATLGRPDYVSTLFEDMSAGPVFQKFLGDAARSICTEMANDEPDMSAEDRILMAAVTPEDTVETNPTAVDANLAQLMLRFHGLSLETDAPVLSKYRWLFESVTHTTNDPTQGWRLVCIALMSHPRFYSY